MRKAITSMFGFLFVLGLMSIAEATLSDLGNEIMISHLYENDISIQFLDPPVDLALQAVDCSV